MITKEVISRKRSSLPLSHAHLSGRNLGGMYRDMRRWIRLGGSLHNSIKSELMRVGLKRLFEDPASCYIVYLESNQIKYLPSAVQQGPGKMAGSNSLDCYGP